MVELADSTFIAFGGSYKFFVTYITDSKGNTTEIPHHVNKDIFLIRLSPLGEVLNFKRYDRLDDSRMYQMGEVAYYSDGHKLYFVHHDEGDIYLGVYDPVTDKIEGQSVYNRSDYGRYYPMIGDAKFVADNRLQIPLQRLSKRKILEATFPK